MAGAWVIRSGKRGERDQWALEHGYSGGGWQEMPDLTGSPKKEDVAALVEAAYSTSSTGRKHNYIGQLWALRGRIQKGDLLAMPLKTTHQIAIGRVASGYEYLGDDEDPNKRHVVRVDWIRTDLPRTAVKQDLLFTLGSAMSVFAPSKNNAVARLEHLLEHGTDPGRALVHDPRAAEPQGVGDQADVDDPEPAADIEQVARDRIMGRIAEDFAGHALATLITAILTAEGFQCIQSPPGTDGGIDISAGRGPLGLDSPRLLAQVKSGSQVGAPVVTQLHGVMTTNGAEQGLLVAWGGLSKPAREALRHQHMRVRVWEADDVVEAVLRTYDRLPEELRADLPLRRVWMLSDQA